MGAMAPLSLERLGTPVEVPPEDAALARETRRTLAGYLRPGAQLRLRVMRDDREAETVVLPDRAFRLLLDVLSNMAEGNTVTLVPVHAELTSQQAADLLNVSRPFLIQLLESGEIPYHRVGKHRRVRSKDVMAYKHRIDKERRAVLDELVADAQELGLGYE
jgi:excisionase family DNA binding protein